MSASKEKTSFFSTSSLSANTSTSDDAIGFVLFRLPRTAPARLLCFSLPMQHEAADVLKVSPQATQDEVSQRASERQRD